MRNDPDPQFVPFTLMTPQVTGVAASSPRQPELSTRRHHVEGYV